MNYELIITIVIVILLFIVVAFLGVFGGQNKKRQFPYRQLRNQKTPAALKEPKFTSVSRDKAKKTTAEVPTQEAAVATQPELPLTFIPPELPPPNKALQHDTSYFYLIYFYAEAPLPSAMLQPLLDSLKHHRILPYKILGYSEKEEQWKEEKTEGRRYWLLALPLANRGGRLDKVKLDLVEGESRQLAQKLNVNIGFPSRTVAEYNGRVLDDFCNNVDLMIELRIILPQQESLSRIRELLMMHNMTPENNKYVYRVNSETLFLAQYVELPESTIQSLNFFMDTPKISKPIRAFNEMIDRLKKISILLNGSITDPIGKPVDEARIEQIHQQLENLLHLMHEKGVTPGGSLAHLLFF